MLKLLQLLIFGHVHKWKIVNVNTLDYNGDFGSGTCIRYTMQCEVCGNIKKKDAK